MGTIAKSSKTVSALLLAIGAVAIQKFTVACTSQGAVIIGGLVAIFIENGKVKSYALFKQMLVLRDLRWSLLEKYSCKASKLHLKPRRFKIFVEALEHQLLKDRKKNGRKRSSQGETFSSSAAFPNQNKSSGNDTRAVKIVVVDSHNIQKTGQGKGYLARRNSNISVSRSVISAAAIKRWEKAAMAGVSLVADAAEHLERTAGGNEADPHGGLTLLSIQAVDCSMEQSGPAHSGQVQANLQKNSGDCPVGKNVQTNVKLKLQLFPIDESTRKALEMDKHNPHLELTLSVRKKITSILEHLDRKWGSSRIASGELMLFPFNIQRENLLEYQRWSRDSVVTAADVYVMVGSPSVFRLRYGWIFGTEIQSAAAKTPSAGCDCHARENESHEALLDQTCPATVGINNQSSGICNSFDKEATSFDSGQAHGNPSQSSSVLSRGKRACDGSALRSPVDQRAYRTPVTAGEWADSLTDVSVGDLLTEAPEDVDADCVETPVVSTSRCHGDIPFACDSFDAAIAAHISSQNKMGISGFMQHSSSIWDAEETCDAFSFQKGAASTKQIPSSSDAAPPVAGEGTIGSSSACSDCNAQVLDLPEEAMAFDTMEEDPMEESPSEPQETKTSAKDLSSLTDIYWPDSLGPLEIDIPSCKYYSEDVFLSDSLNGLNRLIASSLDAFQNCSLFSLDVKGSPSSSATGPQGGGASFAGKIGTGDNPGAQSLSA
ncbi:hypothetical protein Cgig2_004417 [Carnegiea gigantea]|uniref:TSL-kinase interacting protein 1 n=1 Tax=Carnegiea gigantea TaxID=171969 RepID=A0A9Q1JYX5_9CARY|nr:hypothetical protein Cgig2_004417 [Carnegiea gigantea]